MLAPSLRPPPPSRRWLRLIPLALALGCASKAPRDFRPPAEPSPPSAPLELDPTQALLVVDDGPRAWQRSQLTGNTTRLMVGDHKHLELHDVEVRARIEGFRARVLIDFVFDNPEDETYEGTFQIRLPGEASPYFLAFGQSAHELGRPLVTTDVDLLNLDPRSLMARRADQWITPKEARIVPRELANLAYDETVHPRLPPPTIHAPAPLPPRIVRDPALAEWAGAGVFNARIFPIAPRKAHRVVIGYDMDLERVGDELELVLPMPQQVPSVHVDLGVRVAPGASVQLSPAPSATNTARDGGLRYELTNPSGPVRLRIPAERAPLLTGGDEAGAFFATRFTPTIPADASAPTSRRAVFLLDTSMSTNPAQMNTWLDLMQAILERNRSSLREFAIVFFDIEARWWREQLVANTPANVAAALEHARALALDGGSDIGAALDAATRPRWAQTPPQWDMFLLSDGAATWGPTDAAALASRLAARAQGPLFAYRAPGVQGDPWLLQQLTDATSGAVFSITRAADIEPVARAHRLRPWTIERVTLDGASDLLLDGAPRVVYPGQQLVLVGRGAPPPGRRDQLARCGARPARGRARASSGPARRAATLGGSPRGSTGRSRSISSSQRCPTRRPRPRSSPGTSACPGSRARCSCSRPRRTTSATASSPRATPSSSGSARRPRSSRAASRPGRATRARRSSTSSSACATRRGSSCASTRASRSCCPRSPSTCSKRQTPRAPCRRTWGPTSASSSPRSCAAAPPTSASSTSRPSATRAPTGPPTRCACSRR
ncbi:MAG: hypothetical protein H6713_03950 [Myxococcales bacterium]|nr:hypothetical protein [Myxococcales bacterium]